MLEHQCEVCGRLWRKKLKANGKIVCNKHYLQFKKHGEFRDNSPRTQRDYNEIIVKDGFAYLRLYNKQYEVIDNAILDIDMIDKVKYIKWRKNNNGYVVNNSKTSMFLHRIVLGVDEIVDHINGNRLDNRKLNLRIVTKSQNQMNVDYKGVYKKHNTDKWVAKIKINQKQIYLGTFTIKEEALYCRWYAEKILFKEYAYPKDEPNVVRSRKLEIQNLVNTKVQRL